jgi:hypothetical protein
MSVSKLAGCSDVRGLEAMDVEGLTKIIFLVVAILAKCEADEIEVPEDFVTHFGVVRSILMRKCIGPDYTESQFCKFFAVLLNCAGEECGATPIVMESLEVANQLTQ